jgi:hypothetical protein
LGAAQAIYGEIDAMDVMHFVPWQKLQMGGTVMQRGVFSEHRGVGPPTRPVAPEGAAAYKDRAIGLGGSGTQAKAEMARGGRAVGAGQTDHDRDGNPGLVSRQPAPISGASLRQYPLGYPAIDIWLDDFSLIRPFSARRNLTGVEDLISL